ncbi:MAG: filamentous hemagglutinin N-terminal domain-containing protein [Coleofasciculus sp. C1-SOL-03]|uniref:two-partner secretion domain-containing protein n=1 Tax=Coleofasciculus sp. C1-SOL-03 TaxID=3069522 RepID=UPI0032F2E117
MMKINKLGGRWQSFIIGTVGLIGTLVTGGNEGVFAQVIPDDTLGAENSVVTPDVMIREILSDRIDGGATRGANLFHSFLEFNIGEGRGVYFANPDGIENILSRVTGDNVSTILGRLGVLGEANLFLLNPNGILFGENASLDIEGSFVATTASGIELGEDGVFSATQPRSSRLLSVSPGALFYNAVEAAGGKITNRGNLTTGRNLTLDGETLDLQGQLRSGRDLTLQAQDTVTIRDSQTNPFIAAAGVNLLVTGNQGIDIFALNHPDSGLFSGGDIVLRSAADVGGDAHYWSGGSFRIEQLDGNLGNLSSPHDPIIRASGDVFINAYRGASLHILAGGKVEIPGSVWIQGADPDNGLVERVDLADGTTLSIDGRSEPTLDIRTGVNSDVIGGPLLTGNGTFIAPAYATPSPLSSDINIGTIVFADAASVPLAGRVLLTNQYQPNSLLSGDIEVTQTLEGGWGAIYMNGGAGNPSVVINSRGGITLDGPVRTSSSFGDGGAIALTAFDNITTGDLNSFSRGSGNGGDITITSDTGTVLVNGGVINSQNYGTGEGGNIDITARAGSIFLRNGARLSSSTFGRGNAGNVNIVAGDTVSFNRGFVFSTVAQEAVGQGGDINITTESLSVSNNAQLNASTFGQGNSGSVTINASDTVSVDNSSTIRSLVGPGGMGDSGGININTRSLLVTGGAELNSSVTIEGQGRAGDIVIDAEDSVTFDNGFARSRLEKGGVGRGGDIRITTGSLSLTGIPPEVADARIGQLVTATFGEGDAGNVIIEASGTVTLDGRGSDIFTLVAQDRGVGNGGDIIIDSESLSVTNEARLVSSVENRGNGGDIIIDSESLSVTNEARLVSGVGGRGDAGNIYVNADVVDISGSVPSSGLPTGLFTSTYTTSDAGDIVIDTRTFRIADGAALSASSKGDGQGGDITVNATSTFEATAGGQLTTTTFAQGQAGNIFVNAIDRVTISGSDPNYANRIAKFPNPISGLVANAITETRPNSGLFANTEIDSTGNGGNIEIVTTNFNLTDNAQISASTSGSGKGGSLTVTAPEAVTIGGNGQLSVETTGDGAAGNLSIDTQRLNLSDSASISASTSSTNPSGVGGNLTINATESFNLTNQASLLAQSTDAAKAGNVTINTEQLTAENGSITTSATATSLGEGGSINVNASQINLKGTEIGLLAETEGVAPAGALTLQPFENGQNLTINLQDNAKISAATSGSGEGGSLSVTAPESITIRGQGQLSVETTGDGAAGNLTIDTQNLTITDGATISASTDSANPDGLGGSLTINASESFTLTNQARLLAQSTGVAPAGTITVDTGQLTANNGSIETSATQSAGGAITITASDIRLFGDSDIRTDVAYGVGGGGNITLTADTILAFADSDILAFAQDGKGGDITFNTPVFFGFAYAPAPKGTDPDTLDHNDRVDINATGAVEGVITLPDDSAVRNSLTPLSTNQIDTDKLIAESCIARRHEPQRGSFFITGTGGIPFRPGDLYDTPYQTGTVRSIPPAGDGEESSSSTRRPWKIGDPIIEPTGIYRLANGELIMGRLCGE